MMEPRESTQTSNSDKPEIGVMDMIKKIGIQIDGSDTGPTDFYIVTPDTTAKELLSRAKLSNFELCPSSSELPFGQNEQIFEKVGDNTVLYAYRPATAGTLASVSMQKLNLLDQRGWWKDGLWFYGYYRTRYGSYQGKIRERMIHIGDFFIMDPPDVLKDHKHWTCFTDKGGGYYSLHFTKKPKSITEGIKSIECLIISAFKENLNGV